MIEVIVDSIRVSLVSQQRIVVLREKGSDRQLVIWIGHAEADSITLKLQGHEVPRPMTHDLLNNVIHELGAKLEYIHIHDLRDDTYFALLVLDHNGQRMEIDARPSDSIALAIRAQAPIFVAEGIMDKVAIAPTEEEAPKARQPEEDEKLGVFREFLETLDLDDLGGEEEPPRKR
ncbi:MAG: bifunctional nuclease family protein [Anaerolineae bacterium]|nr:bifunctional nuclease family protein [Anaerolineae bacterium]